MPSNCYHEDDIVRITSPLAGTCVYSDVQVSLPAGEVGTVVTGQPGDSFFDVEFVVEEPGDVVYCAVLHVQAEKLTPYIEIATN